MPYTEQELGVLSAAVASLPQPVQDILNAKSTEDTAAAIAELVARARRQSMSQVMSSLITGEVASWENLKAAASVADSTTLTSALQAFWDALCDENTSNMLAYGFAALLAARRHHRIEQTP